MTAQSELTLKCFAALLEKLTHNFYRLTVDNDECWRFYFLYYESPSDQDIKNIVDFGVKLGTSYSSNLNYKCYAAKLENPNELVRFNMRTQLAFQGPTKEVPLESIDWRFISEGYEIPHQY